MCAVIVKEQIRGTFKHAKERFPDIRSISFLLDVCEARPYTKDLAIATANAATATIPASIAVVTQFVYSGDKIL